MSSRITLIIYLIQDYIIGLEPKVCHVRELVIPDGFLDLASS